MSATWTAARGRALEGDVSLPGDKSISHRAVMLAALAEGRSHIRGFLEGEDTLATSRMFSQLGVRIQAPVTGERVVDGVGLDGLRCAGAELDCGNAGTGMRLMAGVLAGQAFDSRLVGDALLSKRPMARVVAPLRAMGARIETADGGRPPLGIYANCDLQGIDYKPEIASAQVKSAVLLAGLYARGETRVRERHPTRDYTERMLHAFGWPVQFGPGDVLLSGGHRLRGCEIQVPVDFSAAAFFLVAGSIVPGSCLRLRRVGINPRRTGLLQALGLMGADIMVERAGEQGGEPVADLVVRHAPLSGIDLPAGLVPDMIDELPAFFVAAAAARGRTTVSGAAELRVKESDRIASMCAGLRTLGVQLEERADGAVIEGGGFGAGRVDSHGDHRVAMSLAVAAQLASGEVRIEDCDNVATSFPGFPTLARRLGFGLVG